MFNFKIMDSKDFRSAILDNVKLKKLKFNLKIMEMADVKEIIKRIKKYAKETNVRVRDEDIYITENGVKMIYFYRTEEDKRNFERLCDSDEYISRKRKKLELM